MRTLTVDEIGFVSGGMEEVVVTGQRINPGKIVITDPFAIMDFLDQMDRSNQNANAIGGLLALLGTLFGGIAVNYVYDSLDGKEGIDKSIEDFEKWCDEKAAEIAAAGKMAYDDAKCLLKAIGTSGPGGGAPMTCSMTGATGSW